MTRLPRAAHWLAAVGAASLMLLGPLQAHADAGELRARHAELQPQLQGNNFGRPMVIESAETDSSLRGDVYAVLDHPFEKVRTALQDPGSWCDIMLLPFNTRACRASGNTLAVRIGRKPDQPVEQAHALQFGFRNVTASADYLQTGLSAGQGPFGTRNYRIRAEAVPLENGKTFLHMRYSYEFGGAGRFAMQAYMATAGANKVGFTTNGVRGAVERNAMRYYLAIDAYLDTMDAPAGQRVDKRINQWFTATERYPQQLREMDRATYVRLKRAVYERQETASAN